MSPLPANVRFVPYVPGLAMAARSDALIHHGGYGSCQTGLVTGKPAVILPTYSEREKQRAPDRGARRRPPRRGRDPRQGQVVVDVEALRHAVRRSLDEPSFAARARELGDRLRGYGGPAYAATIIEGVCPRRQRTSTVRVVKSLVQASPPAPSGSNSVDATDNGRASGSSP
jgi:UDP:flavonoid glycosyltransferase YjiC (YdhE family)